MAKPSPPLKSIPLIVLDTTVAIVLLPWRALRWFGRGLLRRRRAILYLALVLVALHLIATLVTGRMLGSELARQKAGGYLLTKDQLIPHVPPGEQNAADLYQKAFDTRRLSTEDEGRMLDGIAPAQGRRPSPSGLAAARQVLAANAESRRWLREAANTPYCAFPVNWDASLALVSFPHLARLRSSARMLQADAAVAAAAGRIDDALADCATILRMADHVGLEPVIISQLVGYAEQSIAVRSLHDALECGDPSPRAARSLMAQIAAIDEVQPSIRSVKGEIAIFGLRIFERARHGPSAEMQWLVSGGRDTDATPAWPVRALGVYGTIGRPLFNLDELVYLRAMRTQIDAFGLPWPESQQKAQSLEKLTKTLPTYRGVLTKMTLPIFTRFIWSRDRSTANLGDAQIALALTIYKSQHGAYPDSLTTLEQAGFKLPADPFGGKPFRYRREGPGFIVYSIGPDMKDEGGLPPVWDSPKQLSEKESGYRREHYDIPFSRPR